MAERVGETRGGGMTEKQERTIERVRSALRPCGYAVGVHGSLLAGSDLDLIVVPWIEECEPLVVVLDRLNGAGFMVEGPEHQPEPAQQPHGRLSYVLHGVFCGNGCRYIDLSIFPGEHRFGSIEETKREFPGAFVELGDPTGPPPIKERNPEQGEETER